MRDIWCHSLQISQQVCDCSFANLIFQVRKALKVPTGRNTTVSRGKKKDDMEDGMETATTSTNALVKAESTAQSSQVSATSRPNPRVKSASNMSLNLQHVTAPEQLEKIPHAGTNMVLFVSRSFRLGLSCSRLILLIRSYTLDAIPPLGNIRSSEK
jgi:hypothetical protein